MKILDLEHLNLLGSAQPMQGGMLATPAGQGLVISNEGGKITITDNGIELFSYAPESPLQGFSLYLEGTNRISTHCQAMAIGETTTSSCQISFGSFDSTALGSGFLTWFLRPV
jgi:hypothetical protein